MWRYLTSKHEVKALQSVFNNLSRPNSEEINEKAGKRALNTKLSVQDI